MSQSIISIITHGVECSPSGPTSSSNESWINSPAGPSDQYHQLESVTTGSDTRSDSCVLQENICEENICKIVRYASCVLRAC